MKTIYLIFLTGLLGLTTGSLAQGVTDLVPESKEPAITSGKPLYSASPNYNKTKADSDECNRLYREIDANTGKPQRRYAAVQRYKEQCVPTK